MKRSVPAVWLVVAAIALGLLLLLDPLGWFGAEREDALSFQAEPNASTAEVSAPPEVESAGAELAPDREDRAARRALDPLAEAEVAVLRVLDPRSGPVVGAQVLVVRDDELLFNLLTEEEGEVELAADGEPARVIVAIAHRVLEGRDVVLDAGRQDVVLAEGRHLSVQLVREDGGSPGVLRLGVDSDSRPSDVGDQPAAVEQAVAPDVLWGTYAVLDTDEHGSLELTGLPASWSGRLWLRGGWRVVSTSHGAVGPSAVGVQLPSPAEGVVVRLARRRALHGRLVLRDDGRPLDGAQLSAVLRSPDAESPTYTSARTDGEGRFRIESRQERLSGFELRLGLRFREAAPLVRLDEAGLPADGDLGDVVVDHVRHVPFRLQDSGGEPVAGGVAIASGTRSERTDEDGLGELRWIARDVDRLLAEADGFVPTEAEIPVLVAAPLVVTLQRANELVVELLLPEGSDATQFKVVLRGAERITAGPVENRADQRRHVSEWAFPLFELTGLDQDTYLCARPDPRSASATFVALRPGVELRLEVHGITGEMVYHSQPIAPLAPEERRAVEVPLETGMIVFRGRVLDEDGNGLAHATVQLGGQILGWTEGDGAFECFLADPETGTLLLQHQACTALYLHDYAVPTDGRPVEFRLSSARPLTIEVVDANGTPIPHGEVYTEYGGFTTTTNRVEGHRHLASSMPAGPFHVLVRLAGRTYRQAHDPALSEARVVVPVHGRVVAVVDAATTAGRAGRFTLRLEPPAGEPARPLTQRRDSDPDLRIEIPLVHPGEYQATLAYEPTADESQSGSVPETSSPVPVVVGPGEETEVRLALPAGDG